MFEYSHFENMIVTKAALAIYCKPSLKPDEHINRTYQGLVMNEPHGSRIYYFQDGTVMETRGSEIFFLPKGSSYRVIQTHNMEADSGCYALNFDADISSPPFTLKPKKPEHFLHLFDNAAGLWLRMDKTAPSSVIRTVYDIIVSLEKERNKSYMPTDRERMIKPGVDRMMAGYADPDISIRGLAELCGISEVYFRRLFFAKYGASPKEYLINLRINYAKQLISSGEFSISRVAELCGYPEPCHFSREFSRIVGVPPSEYKR